MRDLAFTEKAHEYGLSAPKGIALIGIPGTGKSLTAKMIGGIWRKPLIRFDEIFFLDLPSQIERKEILAVHLRKRRRIPQDYDLDLLAAKSEGYVRAEIEQAIIDAMYIGFNDQGREFTTQDIVFALSRQVPLSISQRETVEALRAFVPRVIVTHPCAPLDSLALIDIVQAEHGHMPGLSERAAILRAELKTAWAALGAATPTPSRVLYLIWRDPWMTVARDTYISRLLAAAGMQTLPDRHGGDSGAARYPLVNSGEQWLMDVQQVLLSSEPYRFGEQHVSMAQALCPNAQVRFVDGELLSWYGARTAAGLRYAMALAATPVR